MCSDTEQVYDNKNTNGESGNPGPGLNIRFPGMWIFCYSPLIFMVRPINISLHCFIAQNHRDNSDLLDQEPGQE